MAAGDFAKYSNSSQGIPGTTYSNLNINIEDSDTGSIVTESSGIFTPSQPGYYLILATGRFDATHNNRVNVVWDVLQNGSGIAGSSGSGYARNNANPYAYVRAGSILYFNGTTDTFSVRHKRDSGAGSPAGSYGWTRLKLVHLGDNLPYARYGTPTSGGYGGNTPTDIGGWDVITETDTSVLELEGGIDISLKDPNRPYLIIYSLDNSDSGGARTTRVSDITLNTTRIGHSGGYAYQRDSANQHAIPFGIALAHPTTQGKIRIRCWGYDDDAATLWGTFNNGSWTLSSNSEEAGVMIIALPPTTDTAIFNDTTGGDTISGTSTVPLTIMDTEIKSGTNFTKDSDTSITIGTSSDIFAWGTIMVERTSSSGIRNTSATRWQLEGVDQDDSAYGNYLRGEQGTQDAKNMVLSSNYTDSVNAGDTFILEKFDPGTDDGQFDETSWGGAFFIDLKTLKSINPRRVFHIS